MPDRKTDFFGRWSGHNIRHPHLHGRFEDRKRCRCNILRLVRTKQCCIHRWSAKLQEHNKVFHVELLALKHATDDVTSLPHQKLTILVYNQSGVQAVANPRSRNTTARDI
ncbi:hypothetical protein AVEN_62619-1 [Araneus ventricosus]|uniref:Uncharacterized protein n=1 Tax=Araneus ventricosus TaxID=182803 RepID=A0A4Y2LGJ2_ARAVE|nr:hypothetical protein AVEN_62619-1 [Araneus ventricosus]